MTRLLPLSAIALLALGACRVFPDDPAYEPCAEAGDQAIHLSGDGDLEGLDLLGETPSPRIVTIGDFVQAIRVDDPGAFELEARLGEDDVQRVERGLYSTGDGSLLELRLQIHTEGRHLEGTGTLDLVDDLPDWLGVFTVEDLVEGYASDAVERAGTVTGCLAVRSPYARRDLTPKQAYRE